MSDISERVREAARELGCCDGCVAPVDEDLNCERCTNFFATAMQRLLDAETEDLRKQLRIEAEAKGLWRCQRCSCMFGSLPHDEGVTHCSTCVENQNLRIQLAAARQDAADYREELEKIKYLLAGQPAPPSIMIESIRNALSKHAPPAGSEG